MAADLKLASFSDRELLHILDDQRDAEGWVDAANLISVLRLSKNGMDDEAYAKHVRMCIGVRMGWIKRLSGCVERHPTIPGSWRLTERGVAVVRARIGEAVSKVVELSDDYEKLSVLALISQRYIRADVGAANLMRREWTHGTHPLRRG